MRTRTSPNERSGEPCSWRRQRLLEVVPTSSPDETINPYAPPRSCLVAWRFNPNDGMRSLTQGLRSEREEDRQFAASSLKEVALRTVNHEAKHAWKLFDKALAVLFRNPCKETRAVLADLGLSKTLIRFGAGLEANLTRCVEVFVWAVASCQIGLTVFDRIMNSSETVSSFFEYLPVSISMLFLPTIAIPLTRELVSIYIEKIVSDIVQRTKGD